MQKLPEGQKKILMPISINKPLKAIAENKADHLGVSLSFYVRKLIANDNHITLED